MIVTTTTDGSCCCGDLAVGCCSNTLPGTLYATCSVTSGSCPAIDGVTYTLTFDATDPYLDPPAPFRPCATPTGQGWSYIAPESPPGSGLPDLTSGFEFLYLCCCDTTVDPGGCLGMCLATDLDFCVIPASYAASGNCSCSPFEMTITGVNVSSGGGGCICSGSVTVTFTISE